MTVLSKFTTIIPFHRIIAKFMGDGRLPRQLVKKIDKHFAYFWLNDKLLDLKKDDEYLEELPQPIKNEVLIF